MLFAITTILDNVSNYSFFKTLPNYNNFIYLDDPDVSIIVTGSNTAGNMYTLTCEVSVAAGLPNITWMYNNTKVIEESGITLTLEEIGLDSRLIIQFSPLDYNHAGVYTCSANLTVEEFDFDGFNEASQTVNVQSKYRVFYKQFTA